MYIKRKGVALDEVGPNDVVEVDDPSAALHLETVIHTEIYALRPDVGAIVHGHPPYVTAFGATNARARAAHARRRPVRRRRLVLRGDAPS